jgi:hypothetical protein
MANVLYKLTAKKNVGKLPAGASAEIIKTTAQSGPSASEITEAFEDKYGIKIPNGMANKSYFDIVKK